MATLSDEFEVGQRVVCIRPEVFAGTIGKYLTDRIGIVEAVTPVVRPDIMYAKALNKVWVIWQKRGTRGKERRMQMVPRDIEVTYEVTGEEMLKILDASKSTLYRWEGGFFCASPQPDGFTCGQAPKQPWIGTAMYQLMLTTGAISLKVERKP